MSRLFPPVAELYMEKNGSPMDLSTPSFNAGLMLLNLECWRRTQTTDMVWWHEIISVP